MWPNQHRWSLSRPKSRRTNRPRHASRGGMRDASPYFPGVVVQFVVKFVVKGLMADPKGAAVLTGRSHAHACISHAHACLSHAHACLHVTEKAFTPLSHSFIISPSVPTTVLLVRHHVLLTLSPLFLVVIGTQRQGKGQGGAGQGQAMGQGS